MYSLEDIYKEASTDGDSGNVSSTQYGAYICSAIKISKCYETNEINIYNTTLGGDYYKEITKDEYKIFLAKGWRIGIYVLSLSNYRRKLTRIEKKIRILLTTNKSNKAIQDAKTRRLSILKNFSRVTNKLKEYQYD